MIFCSACKPERNCLMKTECAIPEGSFILKVKKKCEVFSLFVRWLWRIPRALQRVVKWKLNSVNITYRNMKFLRAIPPKAIWRSFAKKAWKGGMEQ